MYVCICICLFIKLHIFELKKYNIIAIIVLKYTHFEKCRCVNRQYTFLNVSYEAHVFYTFFSPWFIVKKCVNAFTGITCEMANNFQRV